MSSAHVKVPAVARMGDVITIRALISHPMESGLRMGDDGRRVPRFIINRFICRFNGEMVLDLDLQPGIAANPYFEFDVTAGRSGRFEFEWIDDAGSRVTASADMLVQ